MKKAGIILLVLLALLVDRLIFMPERLDAVWEFRRGSYMGDPITKKQHFVIDGQQFWFNNGEKLHLVGCYFGELILYDFEKNRITRYSEW